MTTKRRRINRTRRWQFTPEALRAFRHMLELQEQCSCEPRDWDGEYWKHKPCPACEAWGDEHSTVMHELQLAPHEDIQDPDAKSPYPEGCFADKHFYSSRDPAAMERWRALEKAVKAQE